MRTGAAHGRVGHVHEAGFYSSDAEFLALIVPFVTGDAVGCSCPHPCAPDFANCSENTGSNSISRATNGVADRSATAIPFPRA